MNTSYMEHRIVQALGYIANRANGRAITKLVALKLLYLADRDHLRKYGRTILGDEYVAMRYGPVAKRTKDLIDYMEMTGGDKEHYLSVSRIGQNRFAIRTNRPVDTSALSETEIASLDCSIQQLFLHDSIVKFTHQFPEWKKHEAELELNPGTAIPMDYLDFFLPCEDPETEYCDAPERLVSLSREIFEEDRLWAQ